MHITCLKYEREIWGLWLGRVLRDHSAGLRPNVLFKHLNQTGSWLGAILHGTPPLLKSSPLCWVQSVLVAFTFTCRMDQSGPRTPADRRSRGGLTNISFNNHWNNKAAGFCKLVGMFKSYQLAGWAGLAITLTLPGACATLHTHPGWHTGWHSFLKGWDWVQCTSWAVPRQLQLTQCPGTGLSQLLWGRGQTAYRLLTGGGAWSLIRAGLEGRQHPPPASHLGPG